ncbi:MAG: tRNA (adenosine(37)-N6)-dimethylallyltransferase MiaA [Candidatus Latescibacteria bacterium]|jgi:tRNA dimethylallyltransferase|nr:tRNA (adenosine(37)-N6)-dimethylallyltransferase MiaA [Candidatus Latescibacterota bacterium]
MNSTGVSPESGSPEVIVLAGPTASGKTAVGIRLAKALGAEIVSADARQIYRFMDIGTAKPTPEERAEAPHHMVDVADPDEDYSAGRYAREAAAVIDDIRGRGRLPIVVGGSGLYLRALLDGFSPMPEVPASVRDRLLGEAQSDLPGLYARLVEVDPASAERYHPNDTQRVVRALEVYESSGERLSDLQDRPPERGPGWTARWFGLDMDRAELYQRIDRRADLMVEAGLLEEVRSLRERGYGRGLNALNTFGYREIFGFLDGRFGLGEATDLIKAGTRRYAKRQLTWFRADDRLKWFDPIAQDPAAEILKVLDTPTGSS